MHTITRREFLQSLGSTFAAAMLPTSHLWAENDELIAIPPSLMLHSPHGKSDFLPKLLEALDLYQFTPTTYKAWLAAIRAKRPLRKPVLISIDDLTLASDMAYSWQTFAAMKETLRQAQMVATYGVITTPVVNDQPWRVQDAARWDMMVEWVAQGFELASHTSFHSCFSDKYSLPRRDFTQADYNAEICDSAALIEAQLQSRGVAYTVETLILPYGSGYSYMQPLPKVHQGIVTACQHTNIRMIVGIPEGREPFSCHQLLSNAPLYMGRNGPSVVADQRLDVATTVAHLEHWSKRAPLLSLDKVFG